MASAPSVKILEVSRVRPPTNSFISSTESSLPLTFFDIFWLKFRQADRLYYYQFTDSTEPFFNSVILPKLKHSLSLTLLDFLPLAGNITWPDNEPTSKPFILYTPPDDGVFVTVAKSDADFIHLSGNEMRKTSESNPYVPQLPVSDSKAATLSFQITLFPNQGFSIGISFHHAVFDGKSITMFMKAWAYICKRIQEHDDNPCSLPEELIPFFDRMVIQDPYGLDAIYSKNWSEARLPGFNANNPRNLKLLEHKIYVANSVRATFELNLEDINKLRRKIVSQLENDPNQIRSMHHLSRFVISFAYTLVSMVKAAKPEKETNVIFLFMGDCRARLDPPLPGNYFGNCVKDYTLFTQAEPILADNGISYVAKKVSERIKGLEKETVINERSKEMLASYIKTMEPGATKVEGIVVAVAGSPKFEVYGTDFGWGKPNKVEITSLKNEIISMVESRDGNGGIEIGLVLKTNDEMERFDSLFINGLKDL